MPGTDDRIRDALRATAREPSTDGVAERVRAKRQRRKTARRIEAGVLVAAVIAAAAVVSTNVLDNDNRPPEIAVPLRQTEGPIVRVANGLDIERQGEVAKVTPIAVDAEMFIRGPFLFSDGMLNVVEYDRLGNGWDYPPSHIVRIRPDGTFIDRVDLKGEILSLAGGEGARWALTRDKTVTDAEFRVKRIGPDNEPSTSAVPLGEQPVGEIVAAGGGVWVPVRDGVLRFDPVAGAFASKVTLSTVTDRRGVSTGTKAVSVTDGLRDMQLDPASPRPAGVVGEVTSPGVEEVVDLEANGVHLGRNGDGTRWRVIYNDQALELPREISNPVLNASGNSLWVFDSSFVFQLEAGGGQPRVTRTLSISRVGEQSDVFVTFVDADTMFVTSEGRLYRVELSS